MPPVDPKSQLLDLFASLVEVKPIDFHQILAAPLADLQAGLSQARDLTPNIIEIDPASIDPSGVGRLRFLNLHGAATLFAEGLAKNPDIAAEALCDSDTIDHAVKVDLALGRFIFVSEQIWHGGETGGVVAGTAAQTASTAEIQKVRGLLQDLNQPAADRKDLSIAFEEPFRILAEQQQGIQQTQSTSAKAVQPLKARVDQSQGDAALAQAVDAFMSTVQVGGKKS